MAARNPTSFHSFPDEGAMRPGDPIVWTDPDKIFDDMEFLLDTERLILTDCFVISAEEDGTSYRTKATWRLYSKDMCGVSGVTNDEISHEVTLLLWVEDAGETVTARVSSTAVASGSFEVTETATSPTWSSYQAINIKTNGNQDTLTLEMKTSTNAKKVHCGGIGIFALET